MHPFPVFVPLCQRDIDDSNPGSCSRRKLAWVRRLARLRFSVLNCAWCTNTIYLPAMSWIAAVYPLTPTQIPGCLYGWKDGKVKVFLPCCHGVHVCPPLFKPKVNNIVSIGCCAFEAPNFGLLSLKESIRSHNFINIFAITRWSRFSSCCGIIVGVLWSIHSYHPSRNKARGCNYMMVVYRLPLLTRV